MMEVLANGHGGNPFVIHKDIDQHIVQNKLMQCYMSIIGENIKLKNKFNFYC